MKSLILTLLLLTSLTIKSQTAIDTTKNYRHQVTAGNELQLASDNIYKGITLLVIGTVFISISPQIDTPTPFLVIGSGMYFAGTVLYLNSWRHINKAGIILNQNGVGVRLNLK
jgi:hypothetical protein